MASVPYDAAVSDPSSLLLSASVVGIGGGLWLLARGFGGYRRAGLVADTGTSRIASLAVGEVRVTGRVEPAELSLISPLQSRSCVYFRAKIRQQQGRSSRTILDDERAVGFRIRDTSGAIRVFPRGAAWDVPPAFKEGDGLAGDSPPGLSLRSGPAFAPASEDHEALVARLLTVQGSGEGAEFGSSGGALAALTGLGRGRREYEESRVEVGDTVTIVGTVLPFDQLPDPDGADMAEGTSIGGPLAATSDPEIAADLEAARAAGTLAASPEEAWGNAAIPGFGIGEPTREPELDPEATPPNLADTATAQSIQRTFTIEPGELVLAVSPDRPMLVSAGAPEAAVTRGQDQFVLGLVGAVLAIASAVVLAITLSGGLPA